MAHLSQRFCRLLQNISVHFTATAPTLWQTLQTAYQEPHRHYHTQQHLSECLQLFDTYHYLAKNPLAVEFALWFHDAVYQPQRFDNEQQSAIWAVTVLEQAEIAAPFIQQVYTLIMATAHQQAPQTEDEKLLIDIDLGILAAVPARFAQYQQQIRAEYEWVAEAIYQEKRNQVLTHLYNNGDIFYHADIKTALESSARINLQQNLNIGCTSNTTN